MAYFVYAPMRLFPLYTVDRCPIRGNKYLNLSPYGKQIGHLFSKSNTISAKAEGRVFAAPNFVYLNP